MSRSRGFTMLELIVAIIVTGILLSITVRGFGSVRARFATDQARQVFESLHARARAQAIESGVTTRLFVDVDADTAAITRGNVVLESIRFMDEFDVNVLGTTLTLCMNPRGFADTSCSSFSAPIVLAFHTGPDVEYVVLLPLGQLVSNYSFASIPP